MLQELKATRPITQYDQFAGKPQYLVVLTTGSSTTSYLMTLIALTKKFSYV